MFFCAWFQIWAAGPIPLIKWCLSHIQSPHLLHPSVIMSVAAVDAKIQQSRLGRLQLSREICLNAGPAYSLRLSSPESRGDMPFSFPAPGVITGSGNGSVGHLGLLCAKRREINVNTLKRGSRVAVSGSDATCPRKSPRP